MGNRAKLRFCPISTPEGVEQLCAALGTNKTGLAGFLQSELGQHVRDVSTIQKWLKGAQSVPATHAAILQKSFRKHGVELKFASEGATNPSTAVLGAETAFPALVSMTVECAPAGGRNRVEPDPNLHQMINLAATIHRGIHDEEFVSEDQNLYYRGQVVLKVATMVLEINEPVFVSNQAHFPPACFFMRRSADNDSLSSQYWTIRFAPIEQGTVFDVGTVATLDGEISAESSLHMLAAKNGLQVSEIEDRDGPVRENEKSNAVNRIREKLLSESLNSSARIASVKFLPREKSDG